MWPRRRRPYTSGICFSHCSADKQTGRYLCPILPSSPSEPERHIFHRQTGGHFDAGAPDLSNSTAGGYGHSGAPQYDRLTRAIALDERAALMSTSWGLVQIMGFNAGAAGFSDPASMVTTLVQSEDSRRLCRAPW